MWNEIKIFAIFIAIAVIGIWARCKAFDSLVAQHPELDEEEKN